MKRYHFKSLRARLTALLIIPVILTLLSAGMGGFFYARDRMLEQWNKSVSLQLEQAAYKIERQLSKPVELMTIFSTSGTSETNVSLLEAIVRRLETLPGVVRVNLDWHVATHDVPRHRGMSGEMRHGRMMHFNRGTFTRISPPRVDEFTDKQTVSMTMILLDNADTAVGNLEIVLEFSYLVSGITANPWWQRSMACIADRSTGRIVLASGLMQGRTSLGETGSALELSIKSELAQKTAGTVWGEGHPPDRVAGFHSLLTFPWSLVIFADGKTILSPIINFRNGFAMGSLFLIALVLIILQLNIGRMSATIRSLAQRAIAVSAGDFEEKIQVNTRDEIGQLAESFNIMIEELREKAMVQQMFGRYVDPDFARALLRQPEAGRLGGRQEEIAVLMADIRGFTPMAEDLPPEKTIEVLNGYFTAMIPIVQRYQGIIVDLVGDGILAFFEPIHEPLVDAAHRCLRCAFDMQAAIDRLNRDLSNRRLPVLGMGVGINSGPVVVGNIGSESRKKYGIVGAAVNNTQRIQSQAGAGEVVISESVFSMLENRISLIREFSPLLKGVNANMTLYSVAPR